MPRSEKLQASINRYRTIAGIQKPTGLKTTCSWWIGLDRQEMQAQAAKEKPRMRPHEGIAGDKGVLYGG
jgi:hypothetical protein